MGARTLKLRCYIDEPRNAKDYQQITRFQGRGLEQGPQRELALPTP